MTNRAARRTNLKRRPKAMKRVEAQVNATSADDLHAKLVAQGVARRAPEDALELYFCQCAYVRIAKVRGIPIDDAFRAVEAEVFDLTGGLPMPMYR